MTVENPLINLKDIHLPPDVSIWPPALGWWILAVVFLLSFVFLGTWIRRRFALRKPKTEAIRFLNKLQNRQNNTDEALVILRDLSQLLRRAALTFCSDKNVASLHGTAWLDFLDRTGKTTEFTQGAGQVFGQELYQQNPEIEIDVLFPLVKKWIIVCNQQQCNKH